MRVNIIRKTNPCNLFIIMSKLHLIEKKPVTFFFNVHFSILLYLILLCYHGLTVCK